MSEKVVSDRKIEAKGVAESKEVAGAKRISEGVKVRPLLDVKREEPEDDYALANYHAGLKNKGECQVHDTGLPVGPDDLCGCESGGN